MTDDAPRDDDSLFVGYSLVAYLDLHKNQEAVRDLTDPLKALVKARIVQLVAERRSEART